MMVVDDAAPTAAPGLFWQVLKHVIALSSAIVLATFLSKKQHFSGCDVGIILSGGNVNMDALAWRQR